MFIWNLNKHQIFHNILVEPDDRKWTAPVEREREMIMCLSWLMYLTKSDTKRDRCILEDLIKWKTSSTPSALIRSCCAWRHINAPVLPWPSLEEREREKVNLLIHVPYSLHLLAHDSDRFISSVALNFVKIFQ